MMKVYLVGGIIRDRMLGVKSDDYDYSVVLDTNEKDATIGFKLMGDELKKQGFKIYLETPDMFTIRAKFPIGHKHEGLDADFVLARKEISYEKNSRKPKIEIGTLRDDLIRRDFTINAMAEDEDGNLIDLFNGERDLKNKILVTPRHASITMLNDPLRLLRALRFCVTKDLKINSFIMLAIQNNSSILDKLSEVVSDDRIRKELNKMFKHDTIKSLRLLTDWDNDLDGLLFPILFKNGYRLEMTNKKK